MTAPDARVEAIAAVKRWSMDTPEDFARRIIAADPATAVLETRTAELSSAEGLIGILEDNLARQDALLAEAAGVLKRAKPTLQHVATNGKKALGGALYSHALTSCHEIDALLTKLSEAGL